MALEKQVYHLSASARRLPTGAVYARSGSTWARNLGRYVQLTADAPVWGARGLMIEAAETNLMIRSIPNNDAVLTNSGLFLFTTASPLIVGRDVQTHAAKATANRPVRSMAAAPDVSTITQDVVWAEVEMIDSEMIDIGWTDAVGNWIDCVRFTLATGAATVLYGSPAAAAIVDSTAGLNGGAMVRVAALKANGHWDRFPAIAPAGTFQTHKRSIVHHLQVAQAADVNSPIVTEGSINSRSRASLVSTIEDPGPAQTLAFEFFTGILAGSRRVIWQLDQDSDTTALSLVMEPGGRLLLVCGSAVLDLGKPNAQSVAGLAFNISDTAIRARLNGGAVQTLAISRPRFTRERWGGAKAAGFETGSLELVEVKRWLSMATDAELLTESTPGEAVAGVANVQSSAGAVFAADFSLAQAPGALRESLVSASSGNAYLLECIGGVNVANVSSTITMRRKKAGEFPLQRMRRVEALFPAYGSLDAGGGGSGVTTQILPTAGPTGGPAWRAVNAGGALTYAYFASMSVPGGNRRMKLGMRFTAKMVSGANSSIFTSGDQGGGIGIPAIPSTWADIGGVTSETFQNNMAFLVYLPVGAEILVSLEPGTYPCLEDLTGCSQTAPSERVRIDVDYGFGAGVRYFPTYCGNSLANGLVVEEEGALIPDRGGFWPMPATANKCRSGIASAASTYVTVADAPSAVAGLPAKRVTANSNGNFQTAKCDGVFTGSGAAKVIARPGPGAGFGIMVYDGASAQCRRVFKNDGTSFAEGDWTWANSPNVLNAYHTRALGGGVFEVGLVFSDAPTSQLYLFPTNNDTPNYFSTDVGKYCDFTAWTAIHSGSVIGLPITPIADADVARVADNPLTGLPAIGTGPFTAFVHAVLPHDVPSGAFPALFAVYLGFFTSMYVRSGGIAAACYSGGEFATANLTVGVPFKALVRREASGRCRFFVDGVLKGETFDSSPTDGVAPRFGGWPGDATSYGPAIHLRNKLFYSALPDADCIAMTAL